MSQAGPLSGGGSGPLPPEVPTSFLLDDGSIAVPIANVLDVFTGFDTTDSASGLRTTNSFDGSGTIFIIATNRISGQGTSISGSTATLVFFTPIVTSPIFTGSYRFDVSITGVQEGGTAAVGYTLFFSAKTDGTTMSIVASPFVDADEDPSMISSTVSVTTSGNTILINANGPTGINVNYILSGTFIQVNS